MTFICFCDKMSDPTKRPLNFPRWHIPYLEKHRILELFHELTRELVIHKPDDHVLFIKQILQNAAANRDVSRVILLEEMSKHTNHVVITKKDIRNVFRLADETVSPKMLAKAITYLVRSRNLAASGWILANCINTEEEAKEMIKFGILPTHVIHIISPFDPDLNALLYCKVQENWPEYRRNLFALRQLFKSKLKEVHIGPQNTKNMESIVKDCVAVVLTKEPIRRVKPRVVILGPRGSGRKTQAKLLNTVLGLVHVDFEYILCQAWCSESEFGEKLRKCKKKVCFHSELLSQVVNKRILEQDCIDKGWVLTGYPYTVTDFQFLDSLETPPNRVIVLDSHINVCKERVLCRKINAYTGSQVDLNETVELKDANEDKVLKVHPKDQLAVVQAEIEYFCANYGSIRKYCGETAMVVNGAQNERLVHECIVSYIVGANPSGVPRKGFAEEIPDVCDCRCVDIPPKVARVYVKNF